MHFYYTIKFSVPSIVLLFGDACTYKNLLHAIVKHFYERCFLLYFYILLDVETKCIAICHTNSVLLLNSLQNSFNCSSSAYVYQKLVTDLFMNRKKHRFLRWQAANRCTWNVKHLNMQVVYFGWISNSIPAISNTPNVPYKTVVHILLAIIMYTYPRCYIWWAHGGNN